jgi:hypothetical protein
MNRETATARRLAEACDASLSGKHDVYLVDILHTSDGIAVSVRCGNCGAARLGDLAVSTHPIDTSRAGFDGGAQTTLTNRTGRCVDVVVAGHRFTMDPDPDAAPEYMLDLLDEP